MGSTSIAACEFVEYLFEFSFRQLYFIVFLKLSFEVQDQGIFIIDSYLFKAQCLQLGNEVVFQGLFRFGGHAVRVYMLYEHLLAQPFFKNLGLFQLFRNKSNFLVDRR